MKYEKMGWRLVLKKRGGIPPLPLQSFPDVDCPFMRGFGYADHGIENTVDLCRVRRFDLEISILSGIALGGDRALCPGENGSEHIGGEGDCERSHFVTPTYLVINSKITPCMDLPSWAAFDFRSRRIDSGTLRIMIDDCLSFIITLPFSGLVTGDAHYRPRRVWTLLIRDDLRYRIDYGLPVCFFFLHPPARTPARRAATKFTIRNWQRLRLWIWVWDVLIMILAVAVCPVQHGYWVGCPTDTSRGGIVYADTINKIINVIISITRWCYRCLIDSWFHDDFVIYLDFHSVLLPAPAFLVGAYRLVVYHHVYNIYQYNHYVKHYFNIFTNTDSSIKSNTYEVTGGA